MVAGRHADRVLGARAATRPYEKDEEGSEDDKKRAPRRFTRLQFKLDSVGWTGDRRRHLYVVPADGSAEAKQITDGDYEDSRPDVDAGRARASRSRSARGEDWDIEPIGDIYLVPADGGEPQAADARRQQPLRAELLAGRDARSRVKWAPGGFDFPRHTADRRRRRRDRREPPRS